MMQSWFECKVRYEKMMENGSPRRVTEPYLVAAENFTDAEARITEEMLPFVSQGEFVISDIKRAKFSELFLTNAEAADRFFKCKVVFITLDEKSGNEKKQSSYMLVQAADFDDARARLRKGMENTQADFDIEAVYETKLMDVFDLYPEMVNQEQENGRTEV